MSEITLVQWIEDGNADISFAGDWAVSVIGFQLFLHREEDYQFRRGNWLKKRGFLPGYPLCKLLRHSSCLR